MHHSYYYDLIARELKFMIPEGKSLLYYGHLNERLILPLQPTNAVFVSEEEPSAHHPDITLIHSRFETYVPKRTFDYIVLDIALGKAEDMNLLLKNVMAGCSAYTRIIIHQENFLWQPILKAAATLGLKNKERTANWLSVNDINTYLKASGFEPAHSFKKTICPVKLGFVGPLLNFICSILPFFDFLKLDQFIVARALRPMSLETTKNVPGLTICLTVRDEEENIIPIVQSLPVICNNQEILFVEGHSKDRTVEAIQQAQAMFPEKNVRLIHQKGKGQGDAIRQGFHEAKGDIIILYEGDGTSDPSDIEYFYECIKNGHFEFIEGSRLSYPMVSESMPFINKVGNILFARWFSWILKQKTTDVLSGIKAIRKKDFDLIYNSWGFLEVTDPFVDFELLYGSVRYGLKVGEIPIHYKPRTYGQSKTNVIRHGLYLVKMALKGYVVFRNSKNIRSNEDSPILAMDRTG